MYFSDVQVKNRQLRAEIVAGEQKRAKFCSVISGTCHVCKKRWKVSFLASFLIKFERNVVNKDLKIRLNFVLAMYARERTRRRSTCTVNSEIVILKLFGEPKTWRKLGFAFFLKNLSQILVLQRSKTYWDPGGAGGEGLLGLIFAGDVPLASQSPYPITVYFVASCRPHLSHFNLGKYVIFAIPT